MLTFPSKFEFEIRKFAACLDYLIWLLLDPSKFKVIDRSKVKKIVLIQTGAIGETLASTVILSQLKKYFNAEIYYFLAPPRKDLMDNNPYVNGVLLSNNNFFKDVNALKKENFDMAILIHPSSTKMALACLLAGIKYRIGGTRGIKDGVNLFLTRKMLDLRKHSIIESYLDIIRILGLDDKYPKREIHVSKKNNDKINLLLKKLKIRKYVVIHPGSGYLSDLRYPSRFWPLERFAKVADSLTVIPSLHVVITGGPGEHKLAEDMIKLSKNRKKIIDLSEKLSLGETIALISKAKMVIAPNTGIAHIASALNTPLVHLCGPDGHNWRPKPTKYCIPLEHNDVCSGCEKIFCRKKNAECINSITCKEVITASNHFLR